MATNPKGTDPLAGIGDTPPADRPPAAAPRAAKRTAKKPAGQGGPGRPPKPKLDKKLEELIGSAGSGLMLAGMARGNEQLVYDGTILLSKTEELAGALDKLAQENPAVRRVLEGLVQTSAWGSLLAVVAAVGVPILANHGVLPAQAAGLVGAELPPPRPARNDDDATAAPADGGDPQANGDGAVVVPMGGGHADPS